MDAYKFGGGLAKKTVSIDNQEVTINKNTMNISDIKKIFIKDATLLELGSVFLSTDGTSAPNSAFLKNGFPFTTKQKDHVDSFLQKILSYSDIEVVAQDDKKDKSDKNTLACPKCKSTNLQFMQNNRKGFSVGKAVGGAVLTGGIGALAGFAGKKGKKNTWYCSDCGNVFESKK